MGRLFVKVTNTNAKKILYKKLKTVKKVLFTLLKKSG
jgi:hypothetical protein